MILQNIKFAFRNASKNKYISLLNILGLSVGLTCALLLLSWVLQEFSFDKFQKNRDTIYRVTLEGEMNGEYVRVSSSHQGVGPTAINQFPEIKNYTRLRKKNRSAFKVTTTNKQFYVEQGFAADSTFFNVFSFEAKYGNLQEALNKRNQVVIDEFLAKKCFGEENALGKVININQNDFTVNAVIKDVPANSHLQFHFLIPTLNESSGWQNNKWGGDNCIQYLLLEEGIEKVELDKKLTQMLYENNNIWQDLNIKMSLQQLSEIHFSSGFKYDNALKGNITTVYVLVSIAFLILLIACVNFTNMFISTSLKRTKSTGIKTVSGATKLSIIKEFSVEILLFILLSFLISIMLVILILPHFNNLTGTQVEINFLSFKFILISLLLIAITIFLAGSFPGIYLTRIKTAIALKSGFTSPSGRKNSFQNGLVTLQFIIAIILLSSVFVINQQVNFFKNKQLGFEKENTLYIHTTGIFSESQNIERLKNELTKHPNITGISARSSLLTDFYNGGMVNVKNNPEGRTHSEFINIEKDYFDVMKIKFIEGGHDLSYSSDLVTDCIINEALAKQLNLTPPYLGQSIYAWNFERNLTIKGVIEDINSKSLSEKVKPCVYTKTQYSYGDQGIILFKLSGNYHAAIELIKEYCQKYNSNIPFEFSFLDQTYDNLYKSEIRLQKMLSWFSVISIILTSLGLLAMAYFMTELRIKEIGVRKASGAKVKEILTMLNKDFVKWVIIAFFIACPIAWYVLIKWLENFAYKTEISWWIFALAGFIALVIALVTVSGQSWRAANKNPIEALRYE